MNRFKSHWVQVLQNLWPVCFFLPHFLQFEELIHGISQLNRLSPHFVKIEILRHFPIYFTLKICSDSRYCLVNFMRTQKFSLSWRLLSHHALKDIDSLVNTAHKSGQSDISHLTFQFRLTNQYSLIAKCMTASLCLNLTVMACWQKPTWTFTKLLTCWQMCVWSWSSWLIANND